MDSARAKQIYDEISEYGIKLERDPASLGPQYLQDQICLCRNYTNAVTHILLEVHREKHDLTSLLTAEEAAYAVESADLLANDRTVRQLPNIEDRKATISVLLRDRSRRINELRGEIQNVDFIEKAVKHRHRELKDTMAEIRTQRSLIRDEIDTKTFYGDETTSVRGKSDASMGSVVLGISEEDLQAIFDPATFSEPVITAPSEEKPSPEPLSDKLSEEQLKTFFADAKPFSTLAEAAALTVPLAKLEAPLPVHADPQQSFTLCPDCSKPQFSCPSGMTCPNGHGYGFPSDEVEPEAVVDVEGIKEAIATQDIEAISAFLDTPVPSPKKSTDDFDFLSILNSI